MQRTALKGRIRWAAYDEREQQLELTFEDRSVRVFEAVPAEVYRRLIASPNPASYFEDRIAEEYPSKRGSAASDIQTARQKLDDLFGG
jgi:hypothetical protein